MANLWFYYAITAAVLWGFSYALCERLLQSGVSVSLLILIEAVLIIPTAAILSMTLSPVRGLDMIFSDFRIFLMAAGVALAAVVGTTLVYMSMSQKNATLTALIEISYPLFVFLFPMLLFRDVQLNLGTAVGGVLVMAGIATIYLKG